MNSWVAATSGLAGVLIGLVGKYLADLKVGQRARLFDEKVKAALRFLDAVEEYSETITNLYAAKFGVKVAAMRVEVALAKEEAIREADRNEVIKYEATREAFKAARQAETALVLLIPAAKDPVVAYLTCAVRHAWKEAEYSDVTSAREAAQDAIRRALGM
ncbi:hypothetical protein [Micromonospora sp. NPDC126480]|uniref:hypothetical protein n=1 Tax=Micromonospora sp. NPDC126480 TaxID=3155312 RepID=UPI00332EB20F